jgi:hypothetical protein
MGLPAQIFADLAFHPAIRRLKEGARADQISSDESHSDEMN